MGVNQVQLQGNLGATPQLNYTVNGLAVATLRLATNEQWKDANGKTQKRTTWHRVVVWGKLAENCAQYLKKGAGVFVTGKLQNRNYEDTKGIKREVTEVNARDVQFMTAGNGGNQAESQEKGSQDLPEDSNDLSPADLAAALNGGSC